MIQKECCRFPKVLFPSCPFDCPGELLCRNSDVHDLFFSTQSGERHNPSGGHLHLEEQTSSWSSVSSVGEWHPMVIAQAVILFPRKIIRKVFRDRQLMNNYYWATWCTTHLLVRHFVISTSSWKPSDRRFDGPWCREELLMFFYNIYSNLLHENKYRFLFLSWSAFLVGIVVLRKSATHVLRKLLWPLFAYTARECFLP